MYQSSQQRCPPRLPGEQAGLLRSVLEQVCESQPRVLDLAALCSSLLTRHHCIALLRSCIFQKPQVLPNIFKHGTVRVLAISALGGTLPCPLLVGPDGLGLTSPVRSAPFTLILTTILVVCEQNGILHGFPEAPKRAPLNRSPHRAAQVS